MKLVCAEKCNIDESQHADLRCELDNGECLSGTIDDGKVTCTFTQSNEEKTDIDTEAATTMKCKVYCKDDLLHTGTAYPILASPSPTTPHTTLAGNPPSESEGTKKIPMKEKYGALIPFAVISISYLLFTITDGAVRMIVLLRAFQKGFSALDVAIMFTLYETAGVFTNLAAGMLGARWGIKTTLVVGLTIQLAGLGMLFAWQDEWNKTQAIIYITASQTLCGIAKDLTKLGGKTVTKLVTPEGRQYSLFKLVSLITGWKNSLKGVGYFLGAATVGVNYYMSLGILCGLILAALPWAIFGLSNTLGTARKESVTFSQLFDNNHNINILSLSRVFLFGSRDMWFEVPLPFFLRSAASGIGWSRALTGAFLAIFIIVYGQVQSWTPQLILRPLRQSPPDKYGAFWWAASLAVPVSILGGIMVGTDIFGPGVPQGPAIAALTTLLFTFCILFAVNSAIHSYLIVRYAEGHKVAMQVGVYYASNALGRLVGTILSGVLYTYAGNTIVESFGVCLFASVGFALLSTVIDIWLHEDAPGAWWLGPFNRCMWGIASKMKYEERVAAMTTTGDFKKKEEDGGEGSRSTNENAKSLSEGGGEGPPTLIAEPPVQQPTMVGDATR